MFIEEWIKSLRKNLVTIVDNSMFSINIIGQYLVQAVQTQASYTTCHRCFDYISFHKISGRSSRASTFKGWLANAFCINEEFYLPREYLLSFSWDNVLALTRIKLQSIRRTPRNYVQQGHKNKRCHFGFRLWNSYCWACCWRWMISS